MSPPNPPAPVAIEGRVLNVGNGRYIANAKVTVEGTNLKPLPMISVSFRINGVPAGEAKVTTSYHRPRCPTTTVNVAAGQTATHNVDLTSAARYGTTTTEEGKEKVIQLDTSSCKASANMRAMRSRRTNSAMRRTSRWSTSPPTPSTRQRR